MNYVTIIIYYGAAELNQAEECLKTIKSSLWEDFIA